MNKKNLLVVCGLALLAAGCNRGRSMYGDGVVSLAGQIVHVDVAADDASRNLGLGGRSGLTDTQGMWFEFTSADRYSFWMKDMNFPIDIIWIENGLVADISSSVPVQPGAADADLATYVPGEPVDRVLELAAGWASRHGLKAGDSVGFMSH